MLTHSCSCLAGKEFVLEELTGGDGGVDGLGGDFNDDENFGQHNIGGNLPSEGQALNKEQLPEVLAGTLDHIVGQLDMMTRTLKILDKRLSLQEDMMAQHINTQSEGKIGSMQANGGFGDISEFATE